MNMVTFETQDLRVRIQDKIAHIDQRRLDGEPWTEIDQIALPVSAEWLTGLIRTSPLKVALAEYERENRGDMALRAALQALSY
jgi:hypothetical protein